MHKSLSNELVIYPPVAGKTNAQLLYATVGVLISLPSTLFVVLGYPVRPALFSLLIVVPLALRGMNSPGYFHNTFTRWLWFMRWLAIMVYLLAHLFYAELSLRAGIAFVVSLGFSFFYEMGYSLASKGMWQAVLRVHVLVVSFICLALLSIVLFWIFSDQPSLAVINSRLYAAGRIYLATWPNYFAISLGLAFGLIAFWDGSKRRFWLLGVIGAVMVLSTSRTGAVLPVITFCIWLWRSKDRRLWIRLVLLLAVMVFVIGVFLSKTFTSENSLIGSLQRAYDGRMGRTEAALDVWGEHLLLGYGFESFGDLVTDYYFAGTLASVGSSHNDYIDLLVRGGLLYSLVFWGWIAALTYMGLRARFRGEVALASRNLASLILGLMIAGFAQNPFKTPEILAVFWYLAGVIANFSGYGSYQRKS